MRRALLALLAIGGLWLGGRALVTWLASDETMIRWRIEEAVESFNETRLAGCLDLVSEDWSHEGSSADRELLKRYLIRLFFDARSPSTKEFRYAAELVEPALAIDVTGDREAQVTLELRLRLVDREPSTVAWHVAVRGTLVRDERGWRLRRTSHRDLAGQRP